MYTTGTAENWLRFHKRPSEIIRLTHVSDQRFYKNSTNYWETRTKILLTLLGTCNFSHNFLVSLQVYLNYWPVYVNVKSIQQTVLHLELLQTRRHNEHYLVIGWWFPPKQHPSLSKESIHRHMTLHEIPYIGLNFMPIFWKEQGWSSGESTHLPPMWPQFKYWCQCHTWLDFVAGSLPWALQLLSLEHSTLDTQVFPSP